MSRIYVASSWRNGNYELTVNSLREAGHEVFDWRNPPSGLGGFHWSELDENWKQWSNETYLRVLNTNPFAARGFITDLRGMQWADTCLMLRPCGRSAHLELGWMAGRGKRTIILLAEPAEEPDLMALLANHICLTMDEVIELLKPSR